MHRQVITKAMQNRQKIVVPVSLFQTVMCPHYYRMLQKNAEICSQNFQNIAIPHWKARLLDGPYMSGSLKERDEHTKKNKKNSLVFLSDVAVRLQIPTNLGMWIEDVCPILYPLNWWDLTHSFCSRGPEKFRLKLPYCSFLKLEAFS